MTERDTRRELAFQGHIIDSYKYQGGLAKKWATIRAVGVPDLICSLPGYGAHLMEVKHIPEFGKTRSVINNPMTLKQRHTSSLFAGAGALVILAVIGGASNSYGSWLYFFDYTAPVLTLGKHWATAPYVTSNKYDVKDMLRQFMENKK